MENKRKINKKFAIIISVLALIGISYGAYKYIYSLYHEDTDDAQIKSNMNPIIPRVAGYVKKVYVEDNQKVKKGDTLFVIDDKDYLVNLEQAKAKLAAAESNLMVSQTSIGSFKANKGVTNSQVSSALSGIETAKINLWRAQNDFERYKNLYENHSITTQQYEEALAVRDKAKQQLKILQDRFNASKDQNTAAKEQMKVSEKQVSVAEANIKSAQALVDAAELNLGYTVVTAQIDGQLSSVDIQEGQFVQSGQALFYLVNTQKKWIVANFKETQLSKMKLGQQVSVKVDAYPKMKLNATITAFSPATGAKFSLLPPDNATGNFVKTVQRLPVKIEFTKDNDVEMLNKLCSGMNVEVDVHLK